MFFGAVALLFEAYILTKWAFGPQFQAVPSGPSVPPQWMKIVMNVFQPVNVLLGLGFFYWFVVRPWRRERRVTFEGLFCVASLTSAYLDAASNYFGPWFAYNSYFFNRGSWMGGIPGWSFSKPGEAIAYPLFVMPPMYLWTLLVVVILGCRIMQASRNRWPRLNNTQLAGICFVYAMIFIFILEGVIFMHLGFWHYGGGHFSISGSKYYKYPLNEVILASCMFTFLTCLRFFRNDKGESFAERGIEELGASPRKKILLRFLALAAMSHFAIGVVYNVPQAFFAARSRAWPVDVQKRSYLTDRLCGAETTRACPGSAVPLVRNGTASVSPDGTLVVPPGAELRKSVPFEVPDRR